MLGARIHTFVALALVGSVALMFALLIWQAASGENPLANAMANAINGENIQTY